MSKAELLKRFDEIIFQDETASKNKAIDRNEWTQGNIDGHLAGFKSARALLEQLS